MLLLVFFLSEGLQSEQTQEILLELLLVALLYIINCCSPIYYFLPFKEESKVNKLRQFNSVLAVKNCNIFFLRESAERTSIRIFHETTICTLCLALLLLLLRLSCLLVFLNKRAKQTF